MDASAPLHAGRGFPSTDFGSADVANVSVWGAPCAVASSTYSRLTCVTGPRPDSGAVPLDMQGALMGLYPGGRGIEFEFYNT